MGTEIHNMIITVRQKFPDTNIKIPEVTGSQWSSWVTPSSPRRLNVLVSRQVTKRRCLFNTSLQALTLNPCCIANSYSITEVARCELSSVHARSAQDMRDVERRTSMLRFHLDFIHVLKYLAQEQCGNIYSMNGKFLDVCLCASCTAKPFVGQTRPLPFSISRGVSWTRGRLEADTSVALLCVFTSYQDIDEVYGCTYRAIVKAKPYQEVSFPLYIHKQQVNLLSSTWWTSIKTGWHSIDVPRDEWQDAFSPHLSVLVQILSHVFICPDVTTSAWSTAHTLNAAVSKQKTNIFMSALFPSKRLKTHRTKCGLLRVHMQGRHTLALCLPQTPTHTCMHTCAAANTHSCILYALFIFTHKITDVSLLVAPLLCTMGFIVCWVNMLC